MFTELPFKLTMWMRFGLALSLQCARMWTLTCCATVLVNPSCLEYMAVANYKRVTGSSVLVDLQPLQASYL